MKRIARLFVSVLTLGLLLTSCNEDDSVGQLPKASLSGKWKYYKQGAVVGGVEVLSEYDGNEPGCPKDYIQFNENGAYGDAHYDSSDIPCEQIMEFATWDGTGNTIVIDYGASSETLEILALTEYKLKVRHTDDGTIQVFVQ